MRRRRFITKAGTIGLGSLGVGGMLSSVACTQRLDTEVIILGGGIAGLYLAHLLEKAGREYVLLEGSNRLGGRLYTHEDLNNREVGGRGIGDKYIELMKLVNELDVPLIDITDYMRSPTAIYKDGQLHNEWNSDLPNPRMLEYVLPKQPPQLEALEDWYKRPDLDLKYSQQLSNLGRTEEEIDVINISANYNDVRNTSALNSLHSGAFRKYNGSKRIFNFQNGSKTLVDAIVAKLTSKPLVNKMVNKIKEEQNSVTVSCKDGSQFKAAKVVTTLPFSTLRDVQLDFGVPLNQKKAIDNLGYTLITQIHLHPTSAYWEKDGIHFDMWTDTPLERIMNTSAQPDGKEIVCWINGLGTHFFDKMTDSDIASYTLDKFKEIRPSTEGNLEYIGTHKWGQYEYNKGAYAEFGVGQAALFEDMIKPAAKGMVHFAGEHTAKASRGIEGAAESAVRVYQELMN